MREWLAIIVIVAIILILADGFRRKIRTRKALRSNLNPDDEQISAELPGGGARIRPRSDIPEERHEPSFGDALLNESAGKEAEEGESGLAMTEAGPAEDESPMESPDVAEAADDFDTQEFMTRRHDEQNAETQVAQESEPAPHRQRSTQDQASGHQQSELPLLDEEETDEELEGADEVEEVIIVNVMAPAGEMLSGKEMLPVLLRCGLRLGNMNIFHRHVDSNGRGPVMFSMANMVKPGTFDMAAMEELETPGVSLFMQLPSRHAYMKSFDALLETANELKNALGGELKDENRSVLTRQTIEHYRQRIRDFELTQLSRNR